tara:strand:+ start:141 stop:647 length:507 start_codon:yes stop_codon:yes gene_type:complete
MMKKLITILLISLITVGCGGFKKVDNRKNPVKGPDRAKKNVAEGRGVSLGGLAKGRGSTSYEFSTSNPMWRATLETLDFLPLATVDYSGGLVTTDWYTDSDSTSDSLKITVRFLSNEIKTNSLKVIVHKKSCKEFNKCKTNILKSKISEELTRTILAKAVVLEKNKKK